MHTALLHASMSDFFSTAPPNKPQKLCEDKCIQPLTNRMSGCCISLCSQVHNYNLAELCTKN